MILVLVGVPIALSEQEAIQALLRRLDSKRSSASVQEAAAKAILNRLLPKHVHSFEFMIVTKVILYLLFSYFPLNFGILLYGELAL